MGNTAGVILAAVLLTLLPEGLRMLAGIDLSELAARYGLDLLKDRQAEIKMMQDGGLVQLSDGKLRLTQAGVPISNSIIATLI